MEISFLFTLRYSLIHILFISGIEGDGGASATGKAQIILNNLAFSWTCLQFSFVLGLYSWTYLWCETYFYGCVDHRSALVCWCATYEPNYNIFSLETKQNRIIITIMFKSCQFHVSHVFNIPLRPRPVSVLTLPPSPPGLSMATTFQPSQKELSITSPPCPTCKYRRTALIHDSTCSCSGKHFGCMTKFDWSLFS